MSQNFLAFVWLLKQIICVVYAKKRINWFPSFLWIGPYYISIISNLLSFRILRRDEKLTPFRDWG